MIGSSTIKRLALAILRADAMELRAVPKRVINVEVEGLPKELQPFLYASGNWGMGYVTIKGQVGRQSLMVMLCKYLAFEIAEKWPTGVDFVAGNVTGGVIPSWEVSKELSALLGRIIPFVYIRDLRKTGGQKELITGIQNNPEIPSGASGLDMEELVNFAQTIRNGATVLREEGCKATKGACILYYDNPVANKELAEAGIEMVYLMTLRQLLDVAEESNTHPIELINEYRGYLSDPLGWQAERGLTHVEKGGTK